MAASTTSAGAPSTMTSLDDVVIVWLNESLINPVSDILAHRDNLFLCSVKVIRLFVDATACREYLSKVTRMHVLLVVSGSVGEKFIPTVHDLPHITYLYVFCLDTNRHTSWSSQWNKTRGVFDDAAALSQQLKVDLRSLTEVVLPFGVSDPQQRSLQSLSSEQSSFVWFQLMIETLLRLPHTPEGKVDMVSECRLHYCENEMQLREIEKFENTYDRNDALRWYTANSFVFHLFNKAFRRQDSETIFKYRYFLVDLLQQLGQLHKEQYRGRDDHLVVYRGQMMFRSELMTLRQSIGQLISINTFFSTSQSVIVASSFAGNGEYVSQGIVSVIFQIDIDLAVPGRPFARIDDLSKINDEREILFPIGSVFLVDNVDDSLGESCFVTLLWNQSTADRLNNMDQVTSLTNHYTRQHIGRQPSVLMFGRLLSEMGLLPQAMRFYIYLHKTLPAEHPDRGVLQNNLGEIFRKLHHFNQARYCFEQALELCADTMDIFHPVWSLIHSNIASLNLDCNKPKEALRCYRFALFRLSRFAMIDDLDAWCNIKQATAIVYHGMAVAFQQLGQLQDALTFHDKALRMQLSVLPANHPELIEAHRNIASCHEKFDQPVRVLEHLEKALQIAEVNLLAKDQRYVSLHFDLAKIHLRLDALPSKVLEHCSRALELIDDKAMGMSIAFCSDVYSVIANIYNQLGQTSLASLAWQRYLAARTRQFQPRSSDFSVSKVPTGEDAQLTRSDMKTDGNLVYLPADPSDFDLSVFREHMKHLCECADSYRENGQIEDAKRCYEAFLDYLHAVDDRHFDRVHRSRLHNNLAACYQDLKEYGEALRHYQLALDILLSEDRSKSMHAALILYNIALIYIEHNDLNSARKHLHQSLAHFREQTTDKTSIHHVFIYRQLVRIYIRCDDWHMVRNYYERIVEELKGDSAPPAILQRYETYLQDAIDKLQQS